MKKISSAKVRSQYKEMIKQIEQMEINYRTAAINYLKKRIDLAIFVLNGRKSEDLFYVYSPLEIEDVIDCLEEKLNSEYLSNVRHITFDVMEVTIEKKDG